MSTDLNKFSVEGRAAFIDFPDTQLKAHEEAYFGLNLQALREVKETWDADGLFQWSQGVKAPQQSRGVLKTEETLEPVTDEEVERFVGKGGKGPTVVAAKNRHWDLVLGRPGLLGVERLPKLKFPGSIYSSAPVPLSQSGQCQGSSMNCGTVGMYLGSCTFVTDPKTCFVLETYLSLSMDPAV